MIRKRSLSPRERLALVALAAVLGAAPAAAVAQPRHGPRHGPEMGGEQRHAWRGGGEIGPGGGPRPGGWDAQRYNGYWIGRRWTYGAPAGSRPDLRLGYVPWRPGAYLPPGYQGAVVTEYWRYHLRRPPYGYHWVQMGDQFLLVSDSTGLIFDVVTGF